LCAALPAHPRVSHSVLCAAALPFAPHGYDLRRLVV
jgi:hypothetical protein